MDVNDIAIKFQDWFMVIVYVLIFVVILLVFNAISNCIQCCKCVYSCICCPARCCRKKYQELP